MLKYSIKDYDLAYGVERLYEKERSGRLDSTVSMYVLKKRIVKYKGYYIAEPVYVGKPNKTDRKLGFLQESYYVYHTRLYTIKKLINETGLSGYELDRMMSAGIIPGPSTKVWVRRSRSKYALVRAFSSRKIEKILDRINVVGMRGSVDGIRTDTNV
jgi:hypothetical protein